MILNKIQKEIDLTSSTLDGANTTIQSLLFSDTQSLLASMPSGLIESALINKDFINHLRDNPHEINDFIEGQLATMHSDTMRYITQMLHAEIGLQGHCELIKRDPRIEPDPVLHQQADSIARESKRRLDALIKDADAYCLEADLALTRPSVMRVAFEIQNARDLDNPNLTAVMQGQTPFMSMMDAVAYACLKHVYITRAHLNNAATFIACYMLLAEDADFNPLDKTNIDLRMNISTTVRLANMSMIMVRDANPMRKMDFTPIDYAAQKHALPARNLIH